MEAKRERKKVWRKKGKKVTASFMSNNLLQVASVCGSVYSCCRKRADGSQDIV